MKLIKKITALLLSLGLMAGVTACGNNTAAIGADSAAQSSQQMEDSEQVNMPNPWIEAESQQEAEAQAGFSVTLPTDVPKGYEGPAFQVIPGEILEADYDGADGARLCIRKAAGTEDTSGDYNEYPECQQVTVEAAEVTMKGSGGAVSLAVWQTGENAYSIGIYDGAGITAEEMTRLVSEMME